MSSFPRLFWAVGVVSIALGVAGCSSVSIPYPLSEPKPVDKEKFEGVWLVDKKAVTVRFASNGIARIACVEWTEDRFNLAQGEMIITEGKKDNFMSVRFEENGAWTNCWVFLQYKFTDNGDLVLWCPNHEVIQKAIKTNRLHGMVNKQLVGTDITITNAPSVVLQFIDDPENLSLFEYREPTILRRIGDKATAEPAVRGDGKPAPQP